MNLVLNDSIHFDNIKSDLTEGVQVVEKVSFEHTDSKLLVEDLTNLITWENEIFKKEDKNEELLKQIPINVTFKSLSLENKIEVFRVLLQVEEVVNSNLLLNIFMLITSNNKYHDESVYQNDYVILGQPGGEKGLEEFLDVKIALKPELEALYVDLTKYYLSCLCSLHYKQTDIAYDSLVIMPVKYNQLISFLTFEDLSRISRRVQNLKDIELVSIYNAKSVLQSLVLNQFPVANFLDLFSTLMGDKNE